MGSRLWIPLVTGLFFAAPVWATPSLFAPEESQEEQPPDLKITVAEKVLQQGAELGTPIEIQGVTKIAFVAVKWTGFVTNPKITILADSATFVADIEIHAGPLKDRQKAKGILVPIYLKKSHRIIVKPEKIHFKLKGSPAIDLSSKMPEIQIPISLPPATLKINKQTVKVKFEPQFAYKEGFLVITSPIELGSALRGAKKKREKEYDKKD